MVYCRGSPTKRRNAMGKGKPKDYRKGLRGHSWKGRGAVRKCSRCGKVPKGGTGLPGPVLFDKETGNPVVDDTGNFALIKVNRLTGPQRKRREAARKKNTARY